MDRVAQAGSGADVIDPVIAALQQQIAEMAAEKDAARAQANSERARAESERARAEAEKARAETEKARAEAEKARADTAERAQAEAMKNPRAVAANAVQRAIPMLRCFENLAMSQAGVKDLYVGSPSKQNGGVIHQQLAVFSLDAKPQTLSLAALAQTSSLEALSAATGQPASLLLELNVYPFLTSFVPAWVNAKHRPAHLTNDSQNAKNLFIGGRNPPVLPHIVLPWTCKPESLTSSAAFHPSFNAEAKPATSTGDSTGPKMYDELVTYVTLGIVGSMFMAVPEGRRRYFTRPPVGYGLAALAHVGYLVAVEWIGKLFVSVVSQPFFLGSPEHGSAIAALPDYDYRHSYEDISFDNIPFLAWPPDDDGARLSWRSKGAEGDDFFKIIRWDAYDADYFKQMLQVYTALSAAWDACSSHAVPPSLLRAQMLFGAGEVCVKMPWIEGRDAVRADLENGGCAVEPVARAIVWLAQRGLLYVDLRPPNVRIAAHDRTFLVDYDDMVVCEPLTSAEELISALLADPAQATIGWASVGGGRALHAVLDALGRYW
jgi:hypothetical protein